MATVLYLEYSEPLAAQVLLTARNSLSGLLVCEVFSDTFTVESALQALQKLYWTGYSPFAGQFYLTSSSLGLGPAPTPGLYSQAFAHSLAGNSLALSHGLAPVSLPSQLFASPLLTSAYPLLPEWRDISAIRGSKVTLTGPFTTLGPGELSLLSLCTALEPTEIRISASNTRSLRLIREETAVYAKFALPPDTLITVEQGSVQTLELRSEDTVVSLSGAEEKWDSWVADRAEGALSELEETWKRIGREIGLQTDLTAYWFLRLCALYCQPHRSYHTLTHILGLFRYARTLPSLSPQLALALWFHDAIYDPKAKDNEEKSAELLKDFGEESGLSLNQPAEWILATKRHQERTGDWEEKALMDLDLGVLGDCEEAYRRYRVGIYREYAWVGEAEYRSQRTVVLQAFLARSQLYYLPLFQAKWDSSARLNLARELEVLVDPSQSLL